MLAQQIKESAVGTTCPLPPMANRINIHGFSDCTVLGYAKISRKTSRFGSGAPDENTVYNGGTTLLNLF